MTAKQLHDKYEQDLKQLQASCKHPEVSEWVQEYWAPAHSTGFEIKVCNICEAIVDRKGGYDSMKFSYTTT